MVASLLSIPMNCILQLQSHPRYLTHANVKRKLIIIHYVPYVLRSLATTISRH